MPFAQVQGDQILEVVGVSLAGSVFVAVVFSLVVLAGARSAEARRAGHGAAALTYGTLAFVAFALFAASVVYGVHVMLAK
jgi:hypothetical protein